MIMSRILLPILAFLTISYQGAIAAEFLKVDQAVPTAFVLKDGQGKTHKLADYKGKVVLVNFWATWCPPCREEMPSMQRLKEKMAGQQFVMLGINSGETVAEVNDFLEIVKVDFPILFDGDSTVTRRWKVYGLPTSFLIDKQGKVRYSLTGTTEWDGKESTALIEGLLR